MKVCPLRVCLGPLLLWLLLSPFLPPVHAQRSNTDFSEVEKTALAELARTKTPGAVMTVISGDRAIFTKAFGVSNRETQTPVTTDMIFRTGSAGKMLTAVVLLMLAEEGKIKMDEPIGRYVSGLTPKLSRVTAHQPKSLTAVRSCTSFRTVTLGQYRRCVLGDASDRTRQPFLGPRLR